MTADLGMPVEIGRIDRELKKLWDHGGGGLTRASLVNFAIYCVGEEAMAENSALIAEFMQSHACRAILIGAKPGAAEPSSRAWISANCHMSRTGAKQVCCEQVTFLLEGDARELIPNIVFSHLDSDLPLYLWWQDEFHEPLDLKLWRWVDRLIFDSARWKNPAHQFRLLRSILAGSGTRVVPCDLNWARTLCIRRAIAQIFDHPDNLALLPSVERVRVVFAPECRTTALLLAGWLLSRLGWPAPTPDELSPGHPRLELVEKPGAPVSECVLTAGANEFKVSRECGSDCLATRVRLAGGAAFESLRPTAHDSTLDLLTDELNRGSRHAIYLDALAAAEPLL
jgi:glucose-6-phosphate dehydrogenase assembly protein OpcA